MDLPKPEATDSKRRSYSEDFKRDAVRLIVEEGYSFKAATQAVGVCGCNAPVLAREAGPEAEALWRSRHDC